jgi:HK97 family phage portal protein
MSAELTTTFYSDPAVAPQASTLSEPEPWFVQWATGNQGQAGGPYVNERTALTYLAVFSCVSLIAGTIAALPLITYRRNKRGRSRATDHDTYGILHDEFNPRMSSPVARETMTGHLLTWGNEYAQIVRNKSGSRVLEIQPLGPDVVDPQVRGGRVEYDVYDRHTGKVMTTLRADEVIHVPALGFDGLVGYSPIRIAKTAIRAGMAQDRESERFITRGIRPPGAIKFPAGVKFKDEQAAIKFRDGFRKLHATEEGSLNIIVLEDGADWMQLGVDPESAQMLESRQFSRAEICGFYRVPPFLVGDMEKTTAWGTGIGEMVDGFIKFTLLQWLNKKEKEYNRKLFGVGKGADTFCEHLVEGLERADIVKRTEAITKQILHGMLSPNEGREVENRNPYEGGDVWFYPLNVGRVDEDGNDIAPPAAAQPEPTPSPAQPPDAEPKPAPEPPKQPGAAAVRLANSLRKVIVAATGRCLRKEAEQARRAAQKPGEFVAWLDGFYAKHAEMLADAIRPPLEAWAAAFPHQAGDAEGWAENSAAMHCERSRRDLLAAAECKPAELSAAVERVAEKWLGERLAEVAVGFSCPTSPPE